MSTLLNPTTSPVTYSEDARVIAAGERLREVTPDRITRAAIQRGDLVEEKDAEPATQEADAVSAETSDSAPGKPRATDHQSTAAPGAPAQEQAG